MKTDKLILDPCCGPRMFYFDKEDDRVLFCDIRDGDTVYTDLSVPGGERTVHVHPDIIADFRELKDIFPDRPVIGQMRGKTIFVVFFKSRS